jgi:ERCC4-type nuclease
MRSENLSTLLHLEQPAPQAYELVMLVDSREFAVAGVLETIKPGIKVEQRALPIGDVIWVWRREKSDEYMAGFAIERKAIDDLSASIMDGRFEEQRRRLARAPGVSTVIYILEGNYAEAATRTPSLLPEASLNTAMRHTELLDGFAVVSTDHAAATAEALIDIHVRIQSRGTFEPKDEESVTYRDFASNTHKTNSMTVAQLTSRMLRAVPGIGAEAVVALHEYFTRIGKRGLTFANIVDMLKDPNINETIKTVNGAKRIPLNATALMLLRQQYRPDS